MIRPTTLGLFMLGVLSFQAKADVLISEVMYHPQSEKTTEEYIELYNPDAAELDIGGWQITSGVDFTFPTGTRIPAGGYLVVAADSTVFAQKYPAVNNFVAGWSGRLSNSSNTITLRDTAGTKRDEVTYTDDSNWGQRRRQDPPDHGHRGWNWFSEADGYGKSLELINLLFDNSSGQNWSPSSALEGTPGKENSVAAVNIPPVISDAKHFPLVPKSADTVTVTCRVIDDQGTGVAVRLHHRLDGSPEFTETPMWDDGKHGDGLAGDRVYGAVLLPQLNGSIVEFYFTAKDTAALVRTWPAPARDFTGDLVQSCNCLYQVDDTVYSGAMPLYRMIMRAADRTELSNINTNTGTPPFPYGELEDEDQTQSHARFNAMFISQDGTGAKLRYLAGVRNRGNGSRSLQPMNFSVQFANEQDWNGRVGINLNSQNTPWQLFGSALFRKAGLTAPDSRAVQIRVNGANPALLNAPSYGFYVCNEFQDADFAGHHFPLDSNGNIYRAQRLVTGLTEGGTDLDGANFEKIVPAVTETLSLIDLFKLNYRKETNVSEDDWSDLIALTEALAKGRNGATPAAPTSYDDDYVSSLESVIDVKQWMRWFAVNVFADNEETNLSNGDGDDFYFYTGANDRRAKLLPYDLDTILGRSGSSNSATHGIFRMTDAPSGEPTPINPFVKHPKFAPQYYAELKRLLDGPFNPVVFTPFVDEILEGVAPASVIATIKTFNTARHAHIATLVPLSITVTASQETGGTALTVQSGLPRTTNSACKLIGVANAVDTRSVTVNGAPAIWSAWEAKWTANPVALVPGTNRILIQSFDAAGKEINRAYHDVWYDDATEAAYSGSLASNETWTAAGGPYRISSSLTIPNGVTLTIKPGTVVMLGSSSSAVNFTVASGGQLIAEGTETQPIRFTRPAGATYSWGGIIINGGAGTPESRIAHAFIDGNGSTAIDVNAGDVMLDHLQFGNTNEQYLSLDGASFLVGNCIFPTATAGFELAHGTLGIKAGGRGIFRDCFFGRAQGYNDVLDFTGGNRPGAILQVINCVFVGTDDDLVDLDGTDAWVEGNIFMHVHRNGSPDSASAVSGGNDSSETSEITIVGNLFYDVDQAATGKQGNFYTLLNNTVVDQNGRGSEDEVTAVVNFADEGTTPAAGMYIEGNIIHSAVALVRDYDPAASTVTFNNNLLPMPWTGPGIGNVVAGPLLSDALNIQTPTEANFRQLVPEIRKQFEPLPGSPAKGTGPNGTDLGGIRAFGVSLSGAPVGTTASTSTILMVGTLRTENGIPSLANAFPQGAGWTHYRWRVNGGEWSGEQPLSTPVTLVGLTNGIYKVEVAGKNDAGCFQNDPAFGTTGRIATAEWIVDSTYVAPPATPLVRINEVLASNTETVTFGSALPDIIELHNAGTALADLSGWGLTDNKTTPYKYKLPAGTTLAPGAYLVIYASGSSNVPQPRTGFGLKASGDTLTLTRSAAAGGGIADAVPFGNQLADYSIGRSRDGSWALCKPTFGNPNVLAEVASRSAVRINEWLAESQALAGEDFIELMNTAAIPVDVGLCYLTDNVTDWPDRHQIRQLTFIAPGSYVSLKADGETSNGPDHLDFKLDALQGEIGLLDSSLALIDNVVYGPQTVDVSQGRTPNGAGAVAFFSQPTPGGPNPAVVGIKSDATVNLLTATHRWRYFANSSSAPANDSQGRNFKDAVYDDSSWPPAAGDAGQLYYIETSALTNTDGFQKTTLLPGAAATRPYQTYYFRTHFNYSGPLSGVTLSARIMVDDGAVIYLNGAEVRRIRMPSGTPSYSTLANSNVNDATVETFNIPTGSLREGDNVLAVEVHQVNNQSGSSPSSDVVWGMTMNATFTVITGTIPAVLNEVFAMNSPQPSSGDLYAGWIELHNRGDAPWDVSDMSLSTSVTQPRWFVFPAGTSIPAGGSLVIACDPTVPASATNTGFGLNGTGGVVALYHTRANGGALHDSVAYGRQIPGFSIGRSTSGAGQWVLCVPTRDRVNETAALGALSDVRINEWLGSTPAGPGFLELYNSSSLPIALGGNYLSNDLTDPFKHSIPPLSFIAASGAARWQRWIADDNESTDSVHVNFAVSTLGGGLGLYTAGGYPLDTVTFGAYGAGQSGGRYPDGNKTLLTLLPSPGSANRISLTIDSDGDGLPDIWELTYGFNLSDPYDALPSVDFDHDGQSNLSEYIAGTDPTSAADRLHAVLDIEAGKPIVRFNAIAGKSYTVQYKESLSDTEWRKLIDIPFVDSTIELEVEDEAITLHSQRFYRIVTPAQP